MINIPNLLDLSICIKFLSISVDQAEIIIPDFASIYLNWAWKIEIT